MIEELASGSALAPAGFRKGDVLLSWERLPNPPANPEGEHGEFRTVFDWEVVRVEQADRGDIRLSGVRRGEALLLTVPMGLWEAKVRPELPEMAESIYQSGQSEIDQGQLAAGTSIWRGILDSKDTQIQELRCWIFWQSGNVWAQARAWDPALAAYESALGAADDPLVRAVILQVMGQTYEELSDFEHAEATYRQALQALGQADESLMAARVRFFLGRTAWKKGQLAEAQEHHLWALGVEQRLAPESLAVATTLHALAIEATRAGDLREAVALEQEALAIRERLAPRSAQVASTLNTLGNAWRKLGNLALAERCHRQALEISAAISPGSRGVARTLTSIGNLARYRGDLDLAEGSFERARGIYSELAPDSMSLARAFNNLGIVASERGEYDRAEHYFDQSLEIKRKLAPKSLEELSTLFNLGSVALDKGDLENAETSFREAVPLYETLAPNSLEHASALDNLGIVYFFRGDLNHAEKYLLQALKIRQKLAAGSLAEAVSLQNLGEIATKRGDFDLALKRYQSALTTRSQLAPGSSLESETLRSLGDLSNRMGNTDLAASYLDRSIGALEAQIARLGGSLRTQGRFRSARGGLYRDAIEVELKRGHHQQALHLLERSKGQSFLELLAERDLELDAELPVELAERRRELHLQYDSVIGSMASLSLRQRDELEELRAQLANLQAELDELTARIRRSSPRLASLQYPEPLTLAGTLEILEPGTVMLAYSVGEEETDLFALSHADGLVVRRLPVGEAELRLRSHGFVELLKQTTPGLLYKRRLADVRREASELYSSLLAPVGDILGRSERLLVVADGPLHRLPFGALVHQREPGQEGRDWEYLAEWKPIHLVLSATVYGQLKAKRAREEEAAARSQPMRLVAFGDPQYPLPGWQARPEAVTDARVRSALNRGLLEWSALPASRWEVKEIASLYPRESVRTFLGSQATEEQAKSLARNTRVAHFATHAYLDEQFPLNSALVLSIPEGSQDGRENGLLQAWEIFEDLRLDADLVVLSACASALGKEQRGEGLIGLTRAFQYAGARSVVASLWTVDDRVTAQLMVHFYRHLKRGIPKDRALRAAQRDLIERPVEILGSDGDKLVIDASAPYYWAAFQLFGDWR